MGLNAGDRLGPYEILSLIGEGGMGAVWKARDTRLGRLVALKVLSAKNISESARQRLMQEARAASVLQHPNIVTVHDVGSENGVDYLVMEHVEGQTLEAKLLTGPMAAGEVAQLGATLASALAHAHQKGIVHRDLKPGNIMLSTSGVPKLLDFGLAKQTVSDALAPTDSTIAVGPATQQGTILGTVAYMSPEQAEGKALDGRSDIFSFGAVLYEMATGRRAFRGTSTLSTLSSILRDEPTPLRKIAPHLPLRLEQVILRCLRKQPGERFASAEDLAEALRKMGQPAQRKTPWGVYGAFAAAAVIAIAGNVFWRGSASDGPVSMKMTPVTTMPGMELFPNLSQDGKKLLFLKSDEDRVATIHVQELSSGEIKRYELGEGPISDVRWSRDGKRILFSRGGWILIRPLDGAEEQRIVSRTMFRFSLTQDWNADESRIVYSDTSDTSNTFITLFEIAKREKRVLTSMGSWNDHNPMFSPDGKQLALARAFNAARAAVLVMPVAGGDPRQVSTDFSTINAVAWSSDGKWIYFSGQQKDSRGIWRVRPDASPGSPAQPVAGGEFDAIAVANSGRLRLAAALVRVHSDIMRTPLDADGMAGEPELVKEIASTAREAYPQYSPDGSRIAFVSDRSGSAQVWVTGKDGVKRVTNLGLRTAAPRWSPDGKMLVCSVTEEKSRWIYVLGLEGQEPRKLVAGARPSWSADGKWIYFLNGVAGGTEVFKVPMEGGAKQQVTRNGGFDLLESPDGKARFLMKTGRTSPIVRLKDDGGEEVIAEGAQEGFWAVTKDFVWWGRGAERMLYSYSIAGGKVRERGKVSRGLGFSVSPDQRSVLSPMQAQPEGDIVLLEPQ